jgi:hypothetical protein
MPSDGLMKTICLSLDWPELKMEVGLMAILTPVVHFWTSKLDAFAVLHLKFDILLLESLRVISF